MSASALGKLYADGEVIVRQGFEFVSRDRALARLKGSAGVADVVESLGQNPLPDAFVVQARSADAGTLEQLRAEMARWPKAEHVQLDSAWAKRLDALLRFGRLAVGMLAGAAVPGAADRRVQHHPAADTHPPG